MRDKEFRANRPASELPVVKLIDIIEGGFVFVCFEGIDGAGKTTQAVQLAERLAAEGIQVERVFDPGTTRVGLAIRQILLENDAPMSAMAQMLLFSAARAELAEYIADKLRDGVVIICDRWLLSTLVYQGYGNGINADLIMSIYQQTSGLCPDMCFLLDLSADAAEKRVGPPRDRYERKTLEDRRAQRDVYFNYATQHSKIVAQQVHILNAHESQQNTHEEVYDLFIRAYRDGKARAGL